MDKILEIFKAESGKTKAEQIKNTNEFIVINANTLEYPLLEEIIQKSDSYEIIEENTLNKLRLAEFQKEHTKNLIKIINEQDFEYGLESSADYFFLELYRKNEAVTKEWLNIIFNENFATPKVLIGILQIVMHMDYYDIYPQGQTMALAALNHKHPEVRECGIRAYENWGTLESLDILRHVKCHEEWLDDYLKQVISDLEEELLKNASVR